MVPDQLRQGAPGSIVHFGASSLDGRRFSIIKKESVILELLRLVLKVWLQYIVCSPNLLRKSSDARDRPYHIISVCQQTEEKKKVRRLLDIYRLHLVS